MATWARWAQDAGSALVDPGRPLALNRRVTGQGAWTVEDTRVAYMILSASSHDAAVDIVRGRPHLSLSDGNSIDIIECQDLP